MKVLVLSVTAGQGHNSIAAAVMEELEKSGVETKKIDILQTSKLRKFIANDLYIYACKHFKQSLTSIFHATQKRDPSKRTGTPVDSMIKPVKEWVYCEIDRYQADAVFTTHVFCARLIGDYKKLHPEKKIVTFSVLHDFTVHPYWETTTDLDYMFTSNEEFHRKLIYKGYRPSQLVETGIPVSERFSQKTDQAQARRALGLDENKTTLLVMNGGGGVANNRGLLKKLNEVPADFQIIFVNGSNAKSKKEIDEIIAERKCKKPILNLGFCKNVDELMAASDCVLGKVGGVSVCESLNQRLPIIIVNEPPAQEYDNMRFLLKNKASGYIEKPKKFVEILNYYLENVDRLKDLQPGIEKIRRPNAARDAADFIIERTRSVCEEKAQQK